MRITVILIESLIPFNMLLNSLDYIPNNHYQTEIQNMESNGNYSCITTCFDTITFLKLDKIY